MSHESKHNPESAEDQSPSVDFPTKPRNLKRVSELDPELREMIPGLFDRMEAERVARQFDIPKPEIMEEVLRDTRAQLMALRRGPQGQVRMAERPRLMVVRGGAA